MNEYEAANGILVVGGGVSLVVAALLMVRKMWLDFLSAKVSTVKTDVELDIVALLREEIERLSTRVAVMEEKHNLDLNGLRSAHQAERTEWGKRMAELESKISALQAHHASVRQDALDAYVFVTSHPQYYDPAIFDELKHRLMQIILNNEGDKNAEAQCNTHSA